MLYLFLGLALVVGVVIFLVKKGKIKDSDGDLIPDVVEDKIEDIKEDIVLKASQIKKEVKEHASEIKEDLGRIAKEATSKPARKPRKTSGGKGGRVEKKPTTSGDGAAVLKNQE